MKKFCPNCGKPVKETDNVCGNCCYKLNKPSVSNQTKASLTPNSSKNNDTVPSTRATYAMKNKDHKKGVMWTCAGILAIVIIGGGIYAGRQYVTSKNNQATTAQNSKLKSSNKVAQSSTKKSTKTSHQEHSEYSNDEWMMMGYIAYKAKDSDDSNEIESGNIRNVINEVNNYFKSGELTAHKNSASSYTLSNEYGSVNVEVKKEEVVVSNDGTSTFSKASLKEVLGGEKSLLEVLVKYLSSSNNVTGNQASTNSQKVAKENIKNFFNAMWIFNSSDSLSERAEKMLKYGDRKAVIGIVGNDAFDNTENQGKQKGTYYQPIEITKSNGLNQLYDVIVYSQVDSEGDHSVKAKINYTVSVDKNGKVNGGSLVQTYVESDR